MLRSVRLYTLCARAITAMRLLRAHHLLLLATCLGGEPCCSFTRRRGARRSARGGRPSPRRGGEAAARALPLLAGERARALSAPCLARRTWVASSPIVRALPRPRSLPHGCCRAPPSPSAAGARAACPNACSARGTCTTKDQCVCEPGYSGNDCSARQVRARPAGTQFARRVAIRHASSSYERRRSRPTLSPAPRARSARTTARGWTRRAAT